MNLSPYLAELLKTNDCVIIPDLGGFVANYKASEYDAQSDRFFPPSKEIIFSSKLKKNDGLLVNFICEREGVKYLDARKMVSEFVTECLFRLESGERVEFDQIGALYFDQHENLLFDGENFNSTRTDAFGLEAFHFPQLVNKYSQPAKPVFRDKDPEPQSERRQAAKYILMGLPILAALYLIPKMIGHDPSTLLQQSNTASISLTETPAAKTSETTPTSGTNPVAGNGSSAVVSTPEVKSEPVGIVPAVEKPVVVQQAADTPSQTGKGLVQTVVNEPSKGKYQVVGGCFKVRENADKLADQLIKKGYPAQVFNLGKEFFRVTVQSFETRKEAETAMSKLVNAEPGADYWLFVAKK